MATDQLIKSDLYRYTGGTSFTSFARAMLLIPGFRFSYFFRKGSSYPTKTIRRRVFEIICRHYSIKFGFQIPLGTQIGPGMYLGHWGQLVINPSTKIGNNCNIGQGVTIGQTNRGAKKGSPKIGDRVWIGANAVLVGNISIDSNVLIAPNSFVNFDVPDNSIVITQKCKVVPDKQATTNYICRVRDEFLNEPIKPHLLPNNDAHSVE